MPVALIGRRLGAPYIWNAVYHRVGQQMISPARLERAATLVAQLYQLSHKSPHSWRSAETVGHYVALVGAQLEQAVVDAERAGFILRRADDEGLIILTDAGRAAATPHRPR